MAERSIVVRLRAEVSDFQRQMGAAGRSLSEFEKSQQRMGGAATTTMGRMVQSARANDREWTMVGRSLLAVGTGITAIGAAMAATGISYNTLQQQSRAALTTLLGSTEAVNAQMAEFDQFARESPFARDVWLKAQQQMLGFGIEAQKVVPYLDAIENAVAATGGSNQDISELTRIFSQIQSAAKITAVDLMQFGQRGVDAASLIGSQMGMTGAQVRESITEGSLDAQTALDALAAGMQQRFGGAADNVKNTMVGAIDRVKAAFRDLSSELVTPLVNPEGGGALVDWLNGLADAMRAFQGAPGWVKGGVTALAGLTAAVTLGAGAFMVGLPRYVEFRDALATLGNTHPALGRVGARITGMVPTLARWTVRLGAAAVAANVLGRAAQGIQESIYGAALGVNEMNRVLAQGNYDSAFAHLTGGYNSFGEALNTLTGSGLFEKLDRGLSTVNQALGGALPDDVQGAANAFASMGDALATMVQGGNADAAAAQFRQLAAAANAQGVTTEQLLDLMPAYRDALVGLEDGAYDAANGQFELAGATDEASEAAEEASKAWQSAVDSMRGSMGGVMGAYQSVIDKNREVAEETAAATGSAESSWEDFYDGATVSMKDWIAAMEEQQSAVRNLRDNTLLAFDQIATDVPGMSRTAAQSFIQEMIEGGEEGAAALQAFVDGTPEQRRQLLDAWAGTGTLWSEIVNAGMVVEPEMDTTQAALDLASFTFAMAATGGMIPVDADMDGATDTVVQWGNSLVGTTVPVDADTSDADETISNWQDTMIGDPVPPTIEVDADPALGTGTLYDWRTDQGNMLIDAPVDADTRPADGTFGKWMGRIEKDTATTNLDADDDPAQSTFAGFAGSATRARVVVPLRADDKPARTVTNSFTSWAGNRNPKVDLGAVDRKARGTTNAFTSWAGNRNPKVDLGAQDRKARNSTNTLTKWMGRRSGRVSVGANDSSARKTVNNLISSIGKRSTSITVNAKKGSGPSVAGFAAGGAIRGPGSGTSDSILAALSNGEHVWTAREVQALGGHGAMVALRASVLSGEVRGFANGGAVEPPRYVVPNVTPVVNVTTTASENGRSGFHVDTIVAADPSAAAQAFSREVQYQMMGAR